MPTLFAAPPPTLLTTFAVALACPVDVPSTRRPCRRRKRYDAQTKNDGEARKHRSAILDSVLFSFFVHTAGALSRRTPTCPRPHADGDARPRCSALSHVRAPPRGAQAFGGSNRLICFCFCFSFLFVPLFGLFFGRVERPWAPAASDIFLRFFLRLFSIVFEFSIPREFRRKILSSFKSFEVCLKAEPRWLLEDRRRTWPLKKGGNCDAITGRIFKIGTVVLTLNLNTVYILRIHDPPF